MNTATDSKQPTPPALASVTGSAAPKRLTDRLARVQDIMLDNRSLNNSVEHEIVWRLFGVISFWARNEHERTASKARWLMSEIEDIVNEKAKRQNEKLSHGGDNQ